MLQRAVAGTEKICVERQDDVGLVDRVHRIERGGGRELPAGADVVATKRLPLNPFRLGEAAQELVDLCPEGRGRHGFTQDTYAAALRSLLGDEYLPQDRQSVV